MRFLHILTHLDSTLSKILQSYYGLPVATHPFGWLAAHAVE